MSQKNSHDAKRTARERAAAMRQEQHRHDRRHRFLIVGGTTVTLALVAAVVIYALVKESSDTVASDVQTSENLARDHVQQPATVTEMPPVGGKHSEIVQNCGIYRSPVKNENAIHSLEHGAVWITYQPDLPNDQVAQLWSLAKGKSHILLSPYPGQPVPVVTSAWGKQLRLTGSDDPKLAKFIKEYVNGPQTPEPGAPCSGGIGSPQDD
jgi:hypothetical protein